jgi:hypothetical protein
MCRAQRSIGSRSTSRADSGATGKLAGLGRHLDSFTFFDEEGNANFDASLQLGGLCHTAAGRVASGARLGTGDDKFHMSGHLQADGVSVVFVNLDDQSFREEVSGISEHLVGKGQGLEAFLVHEVEPICIAVEEGGWNHFEVGLFKLVAGLECLIEDCAGEEIAHFEADERLCSPGGGGGYLRFQAVEGAVWG